jgi:hypothetical protein
MTQPTGRNILTGQDKHQHIEISDGERAVTSADIATSRDGQGPARASLWAASGHIPPGSRARLVDAVLDLPEVQDSPGLQATVPLGDAESLQRLRDRCEDMTTRAAGSSALVDAALRHSHIPDDPQLQL